MAGKKTNTEEFTNTEETNVEKNEQTVKETAADESVKPIDHMKKKTKIKLFKDNDRYKDDLFVCVNGRSFQIKRGVEVEIPEAVAEVIRNSQESDEAAASLISQMENKFEV